MNTKTYKELHVGQEVTWHLLVTGFPHPGTKTIVRDVDPQPRSYNTHNRCPQADDILDECSIHDEECPHGSTIIHHQYVRVDNYEGLLSSGWFAEAQP